MKMGQHDHSEIASKQNLPNGQTCCVLLRSVTFAHKTLCVASHLEKIPHMHNSLDAKRTFEIVKRLGNAMEWVPDLLVVNPKTCDIGS